jgi:hypothetical protein
LLSGKKAVVVWQSPHVSGVVGCGVGACALPNAFGNFSVPSWHLAHGAAMTPESVCLKEAGVHAVLL